MKYRGCGFILNINRKKELILSKPYMLTYDLNSPGQKYDELTKLIKEEISLAWCKYWESSYLLKSPYTPNEIVDKLSPYLDDGDKLFITEIIDNKNGWLTQKQWDFINENILD